MARVKKIRVVCVKFTLASAEEVVDFFCTLSESELGRKHYHGKETMVKRDKNCPTTVLVTLFIKKFAQEVLKHSLKGGLMSPWSQNAKLSEVEVSEVVE